MVIAEATLAYAKYHVVSMSKETAKLYDSPYISGELQDHILKIAEIDGTLQKLTNIQLRKLSEIEQKLGKLAESDEDLRFLKDSAENDILTSCHLLAAVNWFYIEALEIVRKTVNDYEEDNDWQDPFIKSMIIFEKHNVRSKIGLPESIESMGAVAHSVFLNMVTNCLPNPYQEWTEKMSKIAT